MVKIFYIIVLVFSAVLNIFCDPLTEDDIIRLDLLSSTKQELVFISENLSLSSSGTKSQIYGRLLNYYGITDNSGKNGNLFIIKSADTSSTYKLKEINEEYITLSGDIILIYVNDEKNTSQKIKASEIIINNTKKLISAFGNVEYTLEQNDKTDIYTGDEVLIHFDNWSGYFFEGLSQTVLNINDKELVFYFSGRNIERTEKEWIILNKGTITSSNPDKPNYRISADKIIMPVPGEWMVKNAVLYVGRIPVLYIPFFYYSKDSLIFHPAFGYNAKSGYYFQSTLYLFGESRISDEKGLSFFQFSDSEGKSLAGDGLFLRPEDEVFNKNKPGIPYKNENVEYLKIMLDNYTHSGIFTAIEGKFNNTGIADNLEIFLGLARSRNVYGSFFSGFTPFTFEDGTYVDVWNNSYLFNLFLPFRFGLDLYAEKKLDPFKFEITIPIYSDSYFASSFNNRNESIAWEKILGFDNIPESVSETGVPSQLWKLNMSFKPVISPDFKLISSFIVPSLVLSLTMKNAVIPAVYQDTDIINFYYPETFVLPDLSMNLGGSIFSGEINQKKSPEIEISENIKNIKKPDSLSPDQTNNPDSDTETDQEENPDISDNNENPDTLLNEPFSPQPLKSPVFYKVFMHNLAYKINPDLAFSGFFNYGNWEHPVNIDWDVLYYKFQTTPSGNLKYSAGLLENIVTLNTQFNFTSSYLHRFKESSAVITEWADYLLNDKLNTSFNLKNTTTLSGKPFMKNDIFKNTYITYSMGSNIYTYKYNQDDSEFQDTWFSFSEDIIYKHQLTGNLQFSGKNYSGSLNVSNNLPPLNYSLSSFLQLNIKPFSFSVNYSGMQDPSSDIWASQPVNAKLNLNLDNKFSTSATAKYNIDDNQFIDLNGSMMISFFDNKLVFSDNVTYSFVENDFMVNSFFITLYDLKFKLQSLNAAEYNFDIDSGWSALNGTERFRITGFNLSYNKKFENSYFWKNRVKFDFNVNTSLNWDALKYTNSRFNITLGTNINIHKFMDLKFSVTSYNNSVFRYFPGLSEKIESTLPTLNIFEDLLKSFNFFNTQDRIDSNFNLQKISLELVHDLEDWIITLDLSVLPELITTAGISYYDFIPKFSIYVEWLPIPELQKRIEIDNNELLF